MNKSTEVISAEALCELTGLTDRRHRQLAAQGFFPAPIAGEYQRDKALAGTFRHLRELASGKSGVTTLNRARATLAKAKAKEIIHDATLARGELMPIKKIERALTLAIWSWRASLPQVCMVLGAQLCPGDAIPAGQALHDAMRGALQMVAASTCASLDLPEWAVEAFRKESEGWRDGDVSFEGKMEVLRELLADASLVTYQQRLLEIHAKRTGQPVKPTEEPA